MDIRITQVESDNISPTSYVYPVLRLIAQYNERLMSWQICILHLKMNIPLSQQCIDFVSHGPDILFISYSFLVLMYIAITIAIILFMYH